MVHAFAPAAAGVDGHVADVDSVWGRRLVVKVRARILCERHSHRASDA